MAFKNLTHNNFIVPTILVVAIVTSNLKKREKRLKPKLGR
jgi:hypothetical protein